MICTLKHKSKTAVYNSNISIIYNIKCSMLQSLGVKHTFACEISELSPIFDSLQSALHSLQRYFCFEPSLLLQIQSLYSSEWSQSSWKYVTLGFLHGQIVFLEVLTTRKNRYLHHSCFNWKKKQIQQLFPISCRHTSKTEKQIIYNSIIIIIYLIIIYIL